jgi:hypothetical protein
MELTNEQLSNYFNSKAFSTNYKDCVNFYSNLKIHANGEYPKDLIECRRPSESEHIQKYRQTIFTPITEGYFNKILTSLMKIRRSNDWNIAFDSFENSKIIDTETLKYYTETNYPYFNNVTNWLFNICLKQYLIDSNAVCFVDILNKNRAENEYAKPFANIINSENIIEFIDNELAILKLNEYSTYKVGKVNKTNGKVFLVIDKEKTKRFEQTGIDTFTLQSEYTHNLGYLPAFKLKGNYYSHENGYTTYKSKIYPVINRWNEAVREYSDLQAEVVQHIHSEKWIYQTQVCNTCNGIGSVQSANGKVKCTNDKCDVGYVKYSPYDVLTVKHPEMGQSVAPTPPMGYIQKQVEIVGIQDKRVQDHLVQGLASINMEFLSYNPLTQSGEAKKVDRDELNTFVNSIAEDLVAILDTIYKITCDYRYSVIVPNTTERHKMLPNISVPNNFDLLSTDYLMSELAMAKSNKLNPLTINELEIDFVNKKFVHDKEIAMRLRCVLELDPFVGKTEDEKLTELQNDGITQLDYITSCYIHSFVKEAYETDNDFYTYSLTEKKAIINKMAIGKQNELSVINSLLDDVNNSVG